MDNCAGKLIRSNHRLMNTYVQLMPRMVQRRMEELESKAAENAQATEAATISAGAGTADAPQAFQPQLSPSESPQVASEMQGSVVVPANLDIPNAGLELSAATPLTPNTEAPQGLPQPTLAETQRDFGSKQAPVLENLLSEAPTVSKSEGLAGQDPSSQVSPLPGQQS